MGAVRRGVVAVPTEDGELQLRDELLDEMGVEHAAIVHEQREERRRHQQRVAAVQSDLGTQWEGELAATNAATPCERARAHSRHPRDTYMYSSPAAPT